MSFGDRAPDRRGEQPSIKLPEGESFKDYEISPDLNAYVREYLKTLKESEETVNYDEWEHLPNLANRVYSVYTPQGLDLVASWTARNQVSVEFSQLFATANRLAVVFSVKSSFSEQPILPDNRLPTQFMFAHHRSEPDKWFHLEKFNRQAPLMVLVEVSRESEEVMSIRPVFSSAARQEALGHLHVASDEVSRCAERIGADPVNTASFLYNQIASLLRSKILSRNTSATLKLSDEFWDLSQIVAIEPDTKETRFSVTADVVFMPRADAGLSIGQHYLERHTVCLDWNPLFGFITPRWESFDTINN
jgi:hypothetical protein